MRARVLPFCSARAMPLDVCDVLSGFRAFFEVAVQSPATGADSVGFEMGVVDWLEAAPQAARMGRAARAIDRRIRGIGDDLRGGGIQSSAREEFRVAWFV